MSEIRIGDTIHQYTKQSDGSIYYPNDDRYFYDLLSLETYLILVASSEIK